MGTDRDLQSMIRRWAPPAASPDLDRRMISRYRSARGWRARWRRFLHARLSVPLPLVTAGLLLGCVFLLLYLRNQDNPRERLAGFEPVATPRMIVTSAEDPR